MTSGNINKSDDTTNHDVALALIAVFLCISVFWFITDMTTPKVGDTVPCSDYQLITDLYITPGSNGDRYFIIVDGSSTIELELQNYVLIDKSGKKYVYRDHLIGKFWMPANITPINKKGYRDVCEVTV